jgi:hypothetical protein
VGRLKHCDIPTVREVVRIVIALGPKLLFVHNPKILLLLSFVIYCNKVQTLSSLHGSKSLYLVVKAQSKNQGRTN